MKKSYKGFILWLVLFMLGFIPIIHLNFTSAILSKLTLLYTASAITLLAFIIYKTDSVYWYNGILFEDAEAAGYERRSEYAYRHLQFFGRFNIFYTVFVCRSIYLNFSIIIDTLIFTMGLIATAVSTIKIKL